MKETFMGFSPQGKIFTIVYTVSNWSAWNCAQDTILTRSLKKANFSFKYISKPTILEQEYTMCGYVYESPQESCWGLQRDTQLSLK